MTYSHCFYFKWTEAATWYFLQNQYQRQDKTAVIKAHNDTSGDLLMGPEERRVTVTKKFYSHVCIKALAL